MIYFNIALQLSSQCYTANTLSPFDLPMEKLSVKYNIASGFITLLIATNWMSCNYKTIEGYSYYNVIVHTMLYIYNTKLWYPHCHTKQISYVG